ncbi:MAG: hypothetical protein DRO88_03270 [Promethearchaeia archaeon]|nr:MAG: hypothetical protein DRO88_03270 [Candidatus Lokiarchaeia archaeon]
MQKSELINPSNDKEFRYQRRFSQIIDTLIFDLQMNWRKILILSSVAVVIFALSLLLGVWQINRNSQAFPTVEAYIQNYFSFISLFILILAVSYGSNMLVVDFQERTGNLLFPKISKSRLFIGRYLSGLIQGGIILVFYYWLVVIPVFLEFDVIPLSFWKSLGFAVLYYIALLSFSIFFSSIVKRSSGAVITTLLLIIIAFPIINSIFSLSTSVEPLFLLDYYGNIISNILNMPDQRFIKLDIEGLTIYTWFTPSESAALIGLIIYIFIFTIIAYLIYRFRQIED